MSALQALSEVTAPAPRTDHEQPQISLAEAASLATDPPPDEIFARTVHEPVGEAYLRHVIKRLQSDLLLHLRSSDNPGVVAPSWIASHAGLADEVALLIRALRSRVGATERNVGETTSTAHQSAGLDIVWLHAGVAKYRDRLEQLRQFAEDDGESVNEASVGRFFAFLGAHGVVRRASLVLSNANDLCARWRDDDAQREINAEFLPDGRVLWTAVVDGEHQDARTASHEEFIGDVRAVGLEALLYG